MLRRLLLACAFAFAVSPVMAGNVLVVVDIKDQSMQVRVDGVTKYHWHVSTGRSGYETPPGRFQPTRMHKKYFSRTYDNAPMPYSIFFHAGYAIHGTTDLKRLGRVASHGCVRLDPAHAKLLFALVQQNGMDKTVIRVRTHATGLAEMDDPLAPAGKSVELAAAGNLQTVLVDDMTTTGSIEPAKSEPASIEAATITVSWLRKGVGG